MKLNLVDQSNIDGCIHLKGTKMIIVFYLKLKFICLILINDDLVLIKIYRFMGDSKQAMKNEARVEGFICASYIHYETTYFCSQYFNNFLLSLCNIRNHIAIETERRPPMLSMFNQQGHLSRKEFIHWLTDDEKDPAHVHVLISCAEVKSYLE